MVAAGEHQRGAGDRVAGHPQGSSQGGGRGGAAVRYQLIHGPNYTIIQITTLQHDIEQLRIKLDNAKMKLAIEIKMRKQAISDLQALKAELAHKKIQSSLKLHSEKTSAFTGSKL